MGSLFMVLRGFRGKVTKRLLEDWAGRIKRNDISQGGEGAEFPLLTSPLLFMAPVRIRASEPSQFKQWNQIFWIRIRIFGIRIQLINAINFQMAKREIYQ